MRAKSFLLAGGLFAALSAIGAAAPARAAEPIVGLITKTNTNPFFVKMKEGAQAKAKELGVELRTYAGKYDGDNEAEVAAIENLIAAGAKGFMLVPSDSRAIVPAVEKARKAGLLVVTLDTPLDPIGAADITYATDNFKAGELIGQWAAKTLGPKAADARIAMLDLTTSPVTVDYLRDHGFLKGFGIAYGDQTKNGSESDKRVVGHDVTAGAEEGGRKAIENLLQKDPGISLVYTINEPAAAGAYEGLKAAGKAGKVTIVSIDGGCPGVRNVKAGIIGATSMQFPLLMASRGVEAVAEYAKTGKKPELPAGQTFIDTGATLVTDHPVQDVPSIDTTEALKRCWG
ncbi:MAG TPA: sugar ABC transporter substrate-binding protein [Acetobacteraceae bacterium]|jgi:fructose transport system substrate-binding protein|nr:sugar ABC transporter substrate-binding protein [Acetobacteraceae bacterium]